MLQRKKKEKLLFSSFQRKMSNHDTSTSGCRLSVEKCRPKFISSIFCEKTFEEKYLNKQNNLRVRLCNAKNPVPTIHPPSIVNRTPSVLPTLKRSENLQKQEFTEKMKSTSKHSNPWQLQTFQRSMSLLKLLENCFLFSKREE